MEDFYGKYSYNQSCDSTVETKVVETKKHG